MTYNKIGVPDKDRGRGLKYKIYAPDKLPVAPTREQFSTDERAVVLDLDAAELVALVPPTGPLLLTTLLAPNPETRDMSLTVP